MQAWRTTRLAVSLSAILWAAHPPPARCQGETLQAAFAAIQDGDLPRAEELCLGWLRSHPQDVQGTHLLGLVRVSAVQALEARMADWDTLQRRIGPALETLLRAETLAAGSPLPRLHDAVGYLLLLSGRFEEAVGRFDQGLALGPGNPVLYRLRGQARLELGDVAGAVEDLAEAVRIQGDDFRGRYFHALALSRSVGPAAARDSLHTYLGTAPNAPATVRAQAHYESFRYSMLLNDLDAARASIEESVRLDPTYVQGRAELAKLLYESGEPEAAITECDRLLADPATPPDLRALALHYRALAARHAGDLGQARRDFEAALALAPTHAAALQSYAGTLRQLGDLEHAREVTARFGKVVELENDLLRVDKQLYLEPTDAGARARRVDLLIDLGRGSEAREEFDRLRRSRPGSSDIPRLEKRLGAS